jgi:Relaxase/Mobilisation nuclease domain
MHATVELAKDDRVLPYHRLKVSRGQAECIDGDNFIKDVHELSQDELEYHFQRLMTRNELARKKIWHVFLGFHLADHLSNGTMSAIGRDFVQGTEFVDQPWIMYRHFDTLHAHAHIVSTTIKADGTRIKVSLADLKRSRELTHALERKYSLDTQKEEVKTLQKIKYGEISLHPHMQAVLDTVVPTYKYTSLEELNAVLRLYNLKASRGREDSFTYQHRGLIYYPLSDEGKELGAYIKASAFDSKPTLKNLERNFRLNAPLREVHRQRIGAAISWALGGEAQGLETFKEELENESIHVDLRKDEQGKQRIWYIDHSSKAVFEGNTLGVHYTAEAILKRTIPEESYQQRLVQNTQELRLRPHLS